MKVYLYTESMGDGSFITRFVHEKDYKAIEKYIEENGTEDYQEGYGQFLTFDSEEAAISAGIKFEEVPEKGEYY